MNKVFVSENWQQFKSLSGWLNGRRPCGHEARLRQDREAGSKKPGRSTRGAPGWYVATESVWMPRAPVDQGVGNSNQQAPHGNRWREEPSRGFLGALDESLNEVVHYESGVLQAIVLLASSLAIALLEPDQESGKSRAAEDNGGKRENQSRCETHSIRAP